MAVETNAVVRPPATSWGSVLGGWVATIGASVIFTPVVAGLVAATGSTGGSSDIVVAVPVVLGILLAYLVGGYIAGRMAGYRTSWHGMMTAFFSLFVLLLVLLAGGLADRGVFANSGIRSLGDIVPGARDMNIDSLGNAVSFGAMLGFLAAIFGGWLGGLLAPTVPVVAAAPARAPMARIPAQTERAREAPRRGRLLPALGRKGGEPALERDVARDADRDVDEVHTSPTERA